MSEQPQRRLAGIGGKEELLHEFVEVGELGLGVGRILVRTSRCRNMVEKVRHRFPAATGNETADLGVQLPGERLLRKRRQGIAIIAVLS